MTAQDGPWAVEPGYPVSSPSDGVKVAEISHRRAAIAITCGGCPAEWTGAARAHCSGCHETFSGTSLFDAHRSARGHHGTCLNPATLAGKDGQPRMQLRGAIWFGPDMDEDTRERLYGGAS